MSVKTMWVRIPMKAEQKYKMSVKTTNSNTVVF